MVHAGAFLLAGMLVVFSVTQKEEKKFVPPKPVDRPKMKLKKPQVKVKKNAKPKSSSRIVTHVKRASMPDIQLPEMSGMGEGFGGGMAGGFEIMPDLSEISLFGAGTSIGNDFVGTFYDLKRWRNGRSRAAGGPLDITVPLRKFIKKGWRASALASYYQAPSKLYATSFMVPSMPCDIGAEVFDYRESEGWGWAVHYKGQLVHKEGIKFRFVGSGDSILIVRVDGKIVLDANYGQGRGADDSGSYGFLSMTDWQSTSPDNGKWKMGYWYSQIGDWITLEPGIPLDMDVLIGDGKGYGLSILLCVEEDGVKYEKGRPGNPILPMFTSVHPSRAYLDLLFPSLNPDQAMITDCPVFNDFSTGKIIDVSPQPILSEIPEPIPDLPRTKIWTRDDGKTVEAEYVVQMGDKVVFKSTTGKQIKLLHSQLSAQDREYIELINDPQLKVSFFKTSGQRIAVNNSGTSRWELKITEWTFGAKVKQTSARRYNQELKVEYFSIGKQCGWEAQYILLDRGESRFVPTNENDRSHKFSGDQLELMKYRNPENSFGNASIDYDGNLVVVTDKRGKVIAHSASPTWLFENLEALRVLPINAYFDKKGNRVRPAGPKKASY